MAERGLRKYAQEVSESSEVRTGTPLPLGARQQGNGANFALFSRHATRIWLDFFDHSEDSTPSRTIELDSEHHRTGDVWHVWVQGIQPGQLYGYRVDGPYRPQEGLRFNSHKLLLDPCATAITCLDAWDFGPARAYDPESSQRDLSFSALDDAGAVPKCVFTYDHFHWGEAHQPRHPWSESVIYEAHVRGYTIHPTSGVAHPGTYRGLTEKIPYLKDLGVTAVELMPVFEFNENEITRANPLTGERLKNYWGYNPVAFQAPESSYSSAGNAGQQKIEFKQMVKAFHQAGIEVILDVVLNHTAEGNELGPTICLRGLDNAIFYGSTQICGVKTGLEANLS